jgi:hypothetical protein
VSARAWTTALLVFILSATVVRAADLSTYRGFRFGANVTEIATQAGLRATDTRIVHQRPALIQELEWQPRPVPSAPTGPDPVNNGVLSFFEGKLYRIVIAYDRYKIEGMTSEDVIDSISQTYGVARKPGTEIAVHSDYAEVAKVIARWEDADYAYDLVRSGDQASFSLVLYSKQRDTLAQAAILEAKRIDALEAPKRALDAEKKRNEDERLALEKSRAENKPNFKP